MDITFIIHSVKKQHSAAFLKRIFSYIDFSFVEINLLTFINISVTFTMFIKSGIKINEKHTCTL